MGAAFEDEPILDNWRSAPEIVDFNNALYAKLGEGLGAGLDAVYAGQEQRARKGFSGAVEVEVVEGDKADDRSAIVCHWMEQRIRQALADGFSPGDIALLVRTNREAKMLAEYLLGCSPRIVPFTDESLALERHPAALAVVSVMELLVDPGASEHLLRFLQSWGAMEVQAGRPWDEAALLEQHHRWVEYDRNDGTQGRYGALAIEKMLHRLVPGFDPARWSALPLGECMGRILRALDVDRRYPAHAEALMELTTERAALDQGVSGFLAHWHRKGSEQSIRVLPGPDAVRILTVHKSKGLQYPVVITRFGEADIHKSETLIPAWLDSGRYGVPGVVVRQSDLNETAAHETWELEQARQRFDLTNVAYVCTTRAEVRLHVVVDVEKTEWRGDKPPGKLGRMMAKGIEDAFGCDLTSGSWIKGDFERALPLPGDTMDEAPEGRTLPGFEFHGIPDEVLAGRKDEKGLPVLGKMDPRAFGNAVHEVLSRIRTADDADRILNRPWPWLRCAESDWTKVREAVGNVVRSKNMAPWFDGSGRIYAERDIAGSGGKRLRPDRVVDFGDRIEVVDFKTSLEADPAKRGEHAAQMRGYMQALSRPDGPPVKGWVYYVSEDDLCEIQPV